MKSIWDGWEKQAFGHWHESNGARCALGYLDDVTPSRQWQAARKTRDRVASYIKTHYPMPWGFTDKWGNPLTDHEANIIIYANNTLRLTPEDFRRIDRETQISEGMAAVEALVNSVELPVTK